MKNIYNSYTISLGESHILAVEDSMVQAKLLQHFFDNNNINAKLFNNAIDAYKSACENPPVLIVSDIIMPGMDGYEFCSKVKSNPDLSHIPVILLTSLHDPLDIVKGLQAGADNFITKPYDEQYLLSRVHYLLANSDMRRSGAGDMAMEIVFQGSKYLINSDKRQILNLLLSVYEAAINQNRELIEAKQQLEAMNIDLKAANEELDAFARTVSHDLQSPLAGIIGFVQLIFDDGSVKLDEEIRENLHWVLQSAYRMSELIVDLLNYSRSGRASINCEPLNLSDMTNELVTDYRVRNQGNAFHFESEENLNVNADKALMQIALTNLLSNAIKYSGNAEHPEIIFGSKLLYGQRVFFVKDNGVGFDMARADKLFDPFVRLHTSVDFNGTGIGLSTVKRIFNRHGGDVWAESEPGKGATFFFNIDRKGCEEKNSNL
ncbi:MAG: response regulator [Bacteroidia bacterium]|nr:response regulator [Bacteroidia bacterium]